MVSDFYMEACEVTQTKYQDITGKCPSTFTRDVPAGRNGTEAIEDNTIQLNHRRVHSPWLAACLLMPNGVGLGLIPRPRSGTSNGLGDVGMSWGVSLVLARPIKII